MHLFLKTIAETKLKSRILEPRLQNRTVSTKKKQKNRRHKKRELQCFKEYGVNDGKAGRGLGADWIDNHEDFFLRLTTFISTICGDFEHPCFVTIS